jgi:hypothetical protein
MNEEAQIQKAMPNYGMCDQPDVGKAKVRP